MSGELTKITPLIKIQSIPASLTWPLRRSVLRPHLSTKQCQHKGDFKKDTSHFGAFIDDDIAGVASIFREPAPNSKNPNSWRLRGVAVHEHAQNKGVGEKLLGACLEYVSAQDGNEFWCYSRTSAVVFYEKFGLKRKGSVFNFPDVGPVIMMEKK